MSLKKDINNLTENDKPFVTADIMVLGVNQDFSGLKILLVKRDEDPFRGCYTLPGGFVLKNETSYQAASRRLREETGLENIYLDQIYTFTKPERDPRTWVVSIAYLALVSDASEINTKGEWFDLKIETDRIELFSSESDTKIEYSIKNESFKNGKISYENWVATPATKELLAFDHIEILIESFIKLRSVFEHWDLAFNMAGDTFTLPDLQALYELVLGKKLYKTNFRAMVTPKIEATGSKIKSRTSNKMSAEYKYSL